MPLNGKTLIMGILNVTPDSFSDGGEYFSMDLAIKHAENLVKCGADIIDIGGESTRPFAESVSIKEEMDRVIPVIDILSKRIPVPISIDTTKAYVAMEAIYAGASIVNDVSALSFDRDMISVVAKNKVGLILMHMRGTPKDMQLNLSYDSLIEEIKAYLLNAANKAIDFGIDKKSIIIDPGIGFGKTVEHNIEIIKRLNDFLICGFPVLIGSSRKMFIRKILKDRFCKNFNPKSAIVETGTQATISASVMNGANIVRVHNVFNTRANLDIIDHIKNV